MEDKRKFIVKMTPPPSGTPPPPERTPLQKAQDHLRRYYAERFRQAAAADLVLDREGRFLRGLSAERILDWYKTDLAPAERGENYPTRSQGLLSSYKKQLAPLEKIIKVMKPDWGNVENYYRHMFEKPPEGWREFMARVSKRSILGGRNFLKARFYQTMDEGLKAGLNPRHRDPVNMFKSDLNEKRQFVAGYELLQVLKKDPAVGAKFVRSSQLPPEGHGYVDDNGFIVRTWSEADKGYVIRGRWSFPKAVANYLNGQFEPGFREAKFAPTKELLARVIAEPGNERAYKDLAYNMLYNPLLYMRQLKVAGPFHFFVTSNHYQAMAEMMALMNPGTAGSAKRIGLAAKQLVPLYSAFQAARQGVKIAREGLEPGTFPQYREAAANIILGGGRLTADDRKLSEVLSDAFKDAAYALKAKHPGKAIGKLIDLVGRPIMHDFVPNVKIYCHHLVTTPEIAALNKRYGIGTKYESGSDLPDAERQEYEAEHYIINRRAWDFVDQTFGQMTRENIALSNTVKDLISVGTNFPTWNIGNLLLYKDVAGGAGASAAGRGMNLNQKLAIALFTGLLVTLGIHGAIVHRFENGEWPDNMKDIYFPTVNKKTEERGNEASYLKTAVSWATHPLTAITGMTSGIVSMIWELLNNKDWQNIQIRNPKKSGFEQLKQTGQWFLKGWEPIIFSQAERGRSGFAKYGQFAGWQPTPRYIGNTPALQMMDDYLLNLGRKVSSPEEAVRRRDIMGAVDLGRKGDMAGMKTEIKRLFKEYGLSMQEVKGLYKQVLMPNIEYRIQHVDLATALDAWGVASPKEKKEIAPYMASKIIKMAKSNPSRYLLLQDRVNQALPEMMQMSKGKGNLSKKVESPWSLPELRRKYGIQ